jgi:hypothetical protein
VEIYLPWTFVDEGTYKVSLDNIPATTATVDNNNDNAFYGAATTVSRPRWATRPELSQAVDK